MHLVAFMHIPYKEIPKMFPTHEGSLKIISFGTAFCK